MSYFLLSNRFPSVGGKVHAPAPPPLMTEKKDNPLASLNPDNVAKKKRPLPLIDPKDRDTKPIDPRKRKKKNNNTIVFKVPPYSKNFEDKKQDAVKYGLPMPEKKTVTR